MKLYKSIKQEGFTLIELLIAMAISVIVLSAIVTLFVSMLSSNNDNLKSIRLNHELRSVMSLITRDLRRAGANRNAAVDALSTVPSNPFSVSGGTRLTFYPPLASGVAQTCSTYSYDADDGSNELYGYRLGTNGVIEARSNGASCGAGGWTDITDADLVNISAFSYEDTIVEEAGIDVRQITISITGNLVRDPDFEREITETIKVRNDHFELP